MRGIKGFHQASLRHARHFASLLSEANQAYLDPARGMAEGLAIFDGEQPNLLAAWDWLSAHAADPRVAPACAEFPNAGPYILMMRLPTATWQAWLSVALRAADATGALRLQASHLGNLGVTHRRLGNDAAAAELFERQLEVARELGLRQLEATAAGNIGLCLADQGELRRALEFHEMNRAISVEIGHRRGEANALGNLGNVRADLREVDEALRLYEAQLVIVRELGDRYGEANALGNLGLLALDTGNGPRARAYLGEQLALCRTTGDRVGEGNALYSFARAHRLEGNVGEAVECAREAIRVLASVGHRFVDDARTLLADLESEMEAPSNLDGAVGRV